MNDREESRRHQERAEPRKASQQNTENETTEEYLFEKRHDAGGKQNCRHFRPEKSGPE